MKKLLVIILLLIANNIFAYTWDSDTVAVYNWNVTANRGYDDTGNGYDATTHTSTGTGYFLTYYDTSAPKYDAYFNYGIYGYCSQNQDIQMNHNLHTYLGDKSWTLQYWYKASTCVAKGNRISYWDNPVAKMDAQSTGGTYGFGDFWFNRSDFACNLHRIYVGGANVYQGDDGAGYFGTTVFCSFEYNQSTSVLKYYLNGTLKFTFNSRVNPFSGLSSGYQGGYLNFGWDNGEDAGASGLSLISGLDRVIFVEALMSGIEKLPLPDTTATQTETITPTITPTITVTSTMTVTLTVTQTITTTATQTVTQTLTQTVTQTITPTVTITPTFIMIPITDECKCQGDMSFIRFIKGYGFAIIRERLQI